MEEKIDAVEFGGATSVRNFFWKPLIRRIHRGRASPSQQENKANPADARPETLRPEQQKRVVKQGTFAWGSFSAFEDGSIEVETAGVRQWFSDFSDLKCNLNHNVTTQERLR